MGAGQLTVATVFNGFAVGAVVALAFVTGNFVYESSGGLARIFKGVFRRQRMNTCGIVPYGYRVGGDDFFHVYEPEAAVVREMYAWLIDDRLTLYAIQRRLNELGIAPPNQDERRPTSARARGKRTRKTSRCWQGSL